MYSKLQYISQGNTAAEQLRHIQAALDGGCNWIQLRAKALKYSELASLAYKVKKGCSTYNATFIINDHPHLAQEVDADGVHLGLDDMPVTEARAIVGDKIIGGTANTLAHVRQRIAEGCNYIGVGPYRFTTTKEKLSPILGLGGYEQILNDLTEEEKACPIYAIGGLQLQDVPELMQVGIYGIAVSGIITAHSNKKYFIQQLNTNLYEAIDYSRQTV